MGSSLLATIKSFNDALGTELEQDIRNKLNETLKIQIAAEKSLSNDINQMSKDGVIKTECYPMKE